MAAHTDEEIARIRAELGWREPVFPEGVTLVQTCSACPEQYDAFFDDRLIGYLRLRHGWFYAAYPDVSGEAVYGTETKGDGCFDMTERADHLEAAVKALVLADIEARRPI